MRPLTDLMPKCLVPIHGVPLMGYWLEALFAGDLVDRVLINTHYLAEQVEAYVADSVWRDRIDLSHEEKLRGTGGTLLENRAWLGGEPFLVIHADNLTDARLGVLADAHQAAGPEVLLTLLAFRSETPSQCGILELDKACRVTGFHEKVANPPGNLANGAVYVCSPAVIDRMIAMDKLELDLSTEVIPALLPHVLALEHRGFFMDIGSPEALALAHSRFPGPGE